MKTLLLSALLTLFPGELRVIDGDTFDWHGGRVRIANIDAPELSGACKSERALARKATERLQELLAPETFRLMKLARKDRYGRTLAFVWVNHVDIGKVLIEEGLARPWQGRRYPWCT